MQVILLRDVPKIGKKHDIKNISDGYARNFLFPKNLAEPATAARIESLRKQQADEVVKRKEGEVALANAVKALAGTVVSVSAKADTSGHLFKKIRADDVAAAVAAQTGVKLSEETIVLPSPITTIGEHSIEIKVKGATATIVLSVLAV